jgi:hypothetical protein
VNIAGIAGDVALTFLGPEGGLPVWFASTIVQSAYLRYLKGHDPTGFQEEVGFLHAQDQVENVPLGGSVVDLASLAVNFARAVSAEP